MEELRSTILEILKSDFYGLGYEKTKIWSDDFESYCYYGINCDNIVVINESSCVVLDKEGCDKDGVLRIHPSKEIKFWDAFGTKYCYLKASDPENKNLAKLRALGIKDGYVENVCMKYSKMRDQIVYYDRHYGIYMFDTPEFNLQLLGLLSKTGTEIDLPNKK